VVQCYHFINEKFLSLIIIMGEVRKVKGKAIPVTGHGGP
jgi:hypothetical protein